MKNKNLIIILTILFLVIVAGILVGFTNSLDDVVYKTIIITLSDRLTKGVIFITHIGDTLTVIAACLLLLIIKKSRDKIVIPLIITSITSSFLNQLLKLLFRRERPNILRLITISEYSFPSGHSMTNAAIYTMLILLTINYIKNKKYKVLLITIFTILPILIGLSRIYLGVHYFTDVLGGWSLGVLIALIIFIILSKKNLIKNN